MHEETRLDKSSRRNSPHSILTGQPLVDRVGAPAQHAGCVWRTQDSTAQPEAELVPEEREHLFRHMFEALPAASVLWKQGQDGKLHLEMFNAAALKLTQGRLADYVGFAIDDFHRGDPEFADRIKRTFETGETIEVETPYTLRTTGESLWIKATAVKMPADRVLLTTTDITALKRTEAALRASEESYRLIVQTAQEGIWVADAAGKLTLVNSAMADMLGYRIEEIIGTHVWDLVEGPGAAELDAISRRRQPSANQRIEVQLRRKDGGLVWALLSATPIITDADDCVGTLGMMIDITGRVEAEAALRASLEEKDLLLREVHHRVKNNLSIVSSLLDLQAAFTRNQEVQRSLREGQNRILTVARLHEALYQSSDLSNAHMPNYLGHLLASLHESFGTSDVVTENVIADSIMSISQAVHCGLILNELVTNAYKHAFAGSDGKAKRIRVLFEREGEGYQLTVSDNGCGLSEDFNPADSPAFGMELVNLLTEQLHGEIAWDWLPGVGTTVVVSLPGA